MVGRGLAAAPGVDPTTTVGYPEDREAAVGPKLSPAQSRAQHHRSPAVSESSTGPVAGGGGRGSMPPPLELQPGGGSGQVALPPRSQPLVG